MRPEKSRGYVGCQSAERTAGDRAATLHGATEVILVVEDDARPAEADRETPGRQRPSHGRACRRRFGPGMARARSRRSLMLLDYSLPDMHGEQLLERIEASGSSVPFVVATGHGSESVAVEMMKRGAYDYLVKGATFMKLLPAVVDQALERVRQAERLAEAEEQLRAGPRRIGAARRSSARRSWPRPTAACAWRWRSAAAPRNRCSSTRPSWPTWRG